MITQRNNLVNQMLKNIKISEKLHKRISIKAAELVIKKSDLAEALLMLGLEVPDEQILKITQFLADYKNQAEKEDLTQ